MRVFPATDPSATLLQWQQHLLFAQEIIGVRYSAKGLTIQQYERNDIGK
jgi:hypothetical protein